MIPRRSRRSTSFSLSRLRTIEPGTQSAANRLSSNAARLRYTPSMIHDGRSRKLPFDPAKAVAHLRASDPKLAKLIDCAGPFTLRLDRTTSPFESLLESILYQQLHGKAAATIHQIGR